MKRKFNVSLKKDFIFQVHLYFSYTKSQTSATISYSNETLNSGENAPLQTSFLKIDVAIAAFKNLLNMAVLEECLNKTDIEKIG